MAVRTTEAAVELIIETEVSISLTSFIEAANYLVTKCCTSTNYTAADLELIERWLAAHCYTIRDMRAESEKAGPVSEKLQSAVDLGFDTSHYGQMAMRLDIEGGLAALNERIKEGQMKTVSITYLGTTNPDAIE